MRPTIAEGEQSGVTSGEKKKERSREHSNSFPGRINPTEG